MTRAAIPILAGHGIRAISFGINAGSAPPGVPKNMPFVWRDPTSGTEVIAMVHPGQFWAWGWDGGESEVLVGAIMKWQSKALSCRNKNQAELCWAKDSSRGGVAHWSATICLPRK